MRKKPQKHKKLSLLLFFIAGIEFLISGMFYAYSLPQPERFTELYFENHTKLPTEAQPNQPYTFSFTVHNLEYQDTPYNYESYLDLDTGKAEIGHGSFTLKQDEYLTVRQEYSLAMALPKTKIVVNLINKNQQIDFWTGK